MADRYTTFSELAAAEPAAAYAITAYARGNRCVVAAPHGGRIEPGTSELARAIAADDLSLYLFEGRKPTDNSHLHITSHRFDEPRGMRLFAQSDWVLTIHGVTGNEKVAYIGGRDESTGASIMHALTTAGFRTARHTDIGLQGLHPRNVCNLGRRRRGVQLELSRGLRRDLLAWTSKPGKTRGRQPPSDKLTNFVEAIRSVIAAQAPAVKRLSTRKSAAKSRK